MPRFRMEASQAVLTVAALAVIAIAGTLPFFLTRCEPSRIAEAADDAFYSGLSDEDHGRKPKLRVNNETGKFKIVIFSDQHYGENAWDEWGREQDVKSDRVSNRVLDYEKPDFVVFNGDQVTANNIMSGNASLYWDKVTAPVMARGIPWASVLGNHDNMEFEWTNFDKNPFGPGGIPRPYSIPRGHRQTSGRRLLLHDSLKPLSLTQTGPAELWPAVGNYHLPVLSQDGTGLAAILYFLDSGGGTFPGVISAAQAKWLKETALRLNPKESVPELVFWHIPSPVFLDVGPSPSTATVDPPCFGSLNDEAPAVLDARFAWGSQDGIVGFLEQRKSIKAVFCGHNHGIEWCCPSRRSTHVMWLCEVRHSGYGGYTTASDALRGAKVVELTEAPFKLHVWVRLEDGMIPDASVGEL